MPRPATAVVLFDGVCCLCHRSVRFIVERDAAGYFRFATLQSAAGERLRREHGLGAGPESVVLIEAGRAFTRSGAALRILRRLRAPWSWLGVLLVVPPPVRDLVYDAIARRRYDWFGALDRCEIPPGEARARTIPGDGETRGGE